MHTGANVFLAALTLAYKRDTYYIAYGIRLLFYLHFGFRYILDGTLHGLEKLPSLYSHPMNSGKWRNMPRLVRPRCMQTYLWITTLFKALNPLLNYLHYIVISTTLRSFFPKCKETFASVTSRRTPHAVEFFAFSKSAEILWSQGIPWTIPPSSLYHVWSQVSTNNIYGFITFL